MKWVLIGLGVVLGGLAVASNLNLANVKEYADKVKTTPQTIKAADLSANGPGDNPYVTLTDFRFRTSDVYVSVWKGNDKKMLGTAYFPLEPAEKGKKPKQKAKAEAMPKDEAKPQEKTPRVVVIASVESPDKVKAYMDRKTITGLVKGSTFESLLTTKEPVEWRVEGRLPEMVWFVWADEKPERVNVARIEKTGYGLGLAALVCLAVGALGFARGRGGERPAASAEPWQS